LQPKTTAKIRDKKGDGDFSYRKGEVCGIADLNSDSALPDSEPRDAAAADHQKSPKNHRRLVERFRGARDGDELTYLICVSCTPPPPPPPLRILAARGDDLNKKKHNEILDQPPWIENDTAREDTLTWV